MKIAMYQVGDSAIATNGFGRKLGLSLMQMPPPNKDTITKGVMYSPEFTCFPFKVVLGMLIHALDNGVDTFIIPKPSKVHACQLADFGMAQKYILEKTGKHVDIVFLDTLNPAELLKKFKLLNEKVTAKKVAEALLLLLQKITLIEEVQEYYMQIYLSSRKKQAQAFKTRWFRKIENTDRIVDLFLLSGKIASDFKKYPSIDQENLLKIAVIGDIYTINEDVINNNIFERLCDLGVYSEKGISLKKLTGMKTIIDPEDVLLSKQARKYLKHNIGGFGQDTIKEAIKYAEKDFDGLIHIYPFSCMPEITVRNILPKISNDYDIPILYLPIDEQTGDAGFTTRIEAFVDLINIRKAKNVFATGEHKNSAPQHENGETAQSVKQ